MCLEYGYCENTRLFVCGWMMEEIRKIRAQVYFYAKYTQRVVHCVTNVRSQHNTHFGIPSIYRLWPAPCRVALESTYSSKWPELLSVVQAALTK